MNSPIKDTGITKQNAGRPKELNYKDNSAFRAQVLEAEGLDFN